MRGRGTSALNYNLFQARKRYIGYIPVQKCKYFLHKDSKPIRHDSLSDRNVPESFFIYICLKYLFHIIAMINQKGIK